MKNIFAKAVILLSFFCVIQGMQKKLRYVEKIIVKKLVTPAIANIATLPGLHINPADFGLSPESSIRFIVFSPSKYHSEEFTNPVLLGWADCSLNVLNKELVKVFKENNLTNDRKYLIWNNFFKKESVVVGAISRRENPENSEYPILFQYCYQCKNKEKPYHNDTIESKSFLREIESFWDLKIGEALTGKRPKNDINLIMLSLKDMKAFFNKINDDTESIAPSIMSTVSQNRKVFDLMMQEALLDQNEKNRKKVLEQIRKLKIKIRTLNKESADYLEKLNRMTNDLRTVEEKNEIMKIRSSSLREEIEQRKKQHNQSNGIQAQAAKEAEDVDDYQKQSLEGLGDEIQNKDQNKDIEESKE